MAVFEGRLTGAKQLHKNLEDLGSTKARAVVRRSLQSASSPPLKKAKQLVPKETGLLKKSLGKKPKTYRSSGTSMVIIGARVGFHDPTTGRNPVKYAHLVELGTVHSAAQPFMRPALAYTKDESIRIFQSRASAGIEREAARMKK